ncbi:hypothetical protein [Bacillus thuringiensis]|uniref:hypothetical protein n=1 Tax=Bacillus thuringiensis TaxID=1428 RepID=UPI0013F14EFB|nr:hypothetical protein [Bacillus thuringiensis]HDR4849363.1 hypothetical protein [Bacillus cereus]
MNRIGLFKQTSQHAPKNPNFQKIIDYTHDALSLSAKLIFLSTIVVVLLRLFRLPVIYI